MNLQASQITNPFSLNLNLNAPPDEKLLKQTFKNPESIHNLLYILKDILQGDNAAAKRDEYSYLNFKQISAALQWLQTHDMPDEFKQLLLAKPYSLVFKEKPPTPEEFLGPKYIGSMSEFLWEPMKEEFIEFLDPMKPYRSGIWNTSIGSGKEQPFSSKIYESDKKWFFMGDAKPGMKVLTPFGDQSTILKVNPQGIKPVYKIKTSDGREVKCGLDHLWTISYRKKENGEKIWETFSTKWLLENKSKYKFEILTQQSSSKKDFTDDGSFNSFNKIKESLIIHNSHSTFSKINN